MKKYLVIGGGHQGLAMSAHLALEGHKVNLWNRTLENIKDIVKNNEINCIGEIEGTAHVEKASSNIDEVLEDIILVTTPANAHRDIAKMLASRVNSNMTIILSPGRTFGAFEFEKTLIKEGCKCIPRIAEMQTIVHTCRRDEKNNIHIIAFKNDVKIAALKKQDIDVIMQDIPECLRQYLTKSDSVLQTSLNNVGLLLHCTPTILNLGWIENPKYQFKYYTDGITPTIAKYIEKIEEERLKIGEKLEIKLETICEWFEKVYNVKGKLLECVNNDVYKQIDAPETVDHRYLNEDIPFGLVPLESLAKQLGVETPYISSIITIASLAMEKDYRQIGIKISSEDLNKMRI